MAPPAIHIKTGRQRTTGSTLTQLQHTRVCILTIPLLSYGTPCFTVPSQAAHSCPSPAHHRSSEPPPVERQLRKAARVSGCRVLVARLRAGGAASTSKGVTSPRASVSSSRAERRGWAGRVAWSFGHVIKSSCSEETVYLKSSHLQIKKHPLLEESVPQ